ncbi:MAG: hypothetical protein JXR84_00290 [Anaerolineae bacterium]|nr:hypothetical protein [Anaerolineae bacterium]
MLHTTHSQSLLWTKRRRTGWLATAGWTAAALVVLAALCVVEINHLQGHITIGNLDYFAMVARTKDLPGSLSAWVNGFYPAGIPLLARFGLSLNVDVAHFGRIVSLFGGLLCGLGTAALALSITRSRAFALIAMACLVSTGTLLFYAGYEGSDMLAAGLQVLALGVLSRNVQNRKLALLAGVIAGLGYLIRYTALLSFLVCAFYCVVLAIYHKDARRLWSAAFYGLGFAAGAAPQIITSLIITGKPFYMTQVYHIWIKLHGGDDFIATWGSDATISLVKLIALDPGLFVRNWWGEFTKFWLHQNPALVDQPLLQLSRAGLLLFVFDRRMRWEHRLLFAIYTVGIVSALSIFTINTRFLIILLPIFTISALYVIWRVIPNVNIKDITIPLNMLALVGLLVVVLPSFVAYAHTHEGGPHANVIETSNRMITAGARSASEVASANLYHQDVSSPTRDTYQKLFKLPSATSLDEWRTMALASGVRFIIYDNETGTHYYPQYETLLNPYERVPGYTPIWTPENQRFVAYRIEPESPQPAYLVHGQFENGIELLGYDLATHGYQPDGSGSAIGLYLYWKTARPVSEMLKVFTHVINDQGALVGQDDSVPVLWTYPVAAWQPEEVVVDYHHIAISAGAPLQDLTINVGLYDAGSGVRVAVLPTGDKITLTAVNIGDAN